jgi:hypothetical protein
MDAAKKGDWHPEIIAAIMSRESRCGLALLPRKPGGNPAGTGDYGHGRGLMQIDDRAHPDFISTGTWTDPQENILYAMVVLNQTYNYLEKHTGLTGDDLRAAAIAGYNCGPGNVRKSLEAKESWDARTTGGDYSEDVLARSVEFRILFQEVPTVTTTPVVTGDTGAQFRVNTDGLNLRSRPDLSPTARIGVLKRGHLVTKIGKDTDPKWWKVDTTLRGIQVQGYVNHGYLIAAQDYVAPPAHTGIVSVHLTENLPKVARNVDGWQAYPR